MKRWFLIGTAVVIIIVASLFYLYTRLGSVIVAAVNKYGSEITQVKVRLNEAEVSATSGQGGLRGLTVANPKGFKGPNAFELGEVRLTLDIGTINRGGAPHVTYELGLQGSNVAVIQRNVDAYTKASRATGDTAKEKANGGPRGSLSSISISAMPRSISAPRFRTEP